MSDQVIDSCVVAKWFLPETDRVKALELLKRSDGRNLIVLDIVYAKSPTQSGSSNVESFWLIQRLIKH
jgi:hypothetical protein